MRYDAEHKQRTRDAVLKAAARAIREHGPQGVGVAAVMSAAGLTHGGFYAHFASRDDLIAAGVDRMFEEGRALIARTGEGLSPAQGMAAYLDAYLSTRHRDTRSSGCPLPYLSADAPRLTPAARQRYADGVASLTAALAARLEALGRADAETEASSVLSEMVGALALARAEPDRERSDLILSRSRDALKRRLNLEAQS